MVCKKEWSKGEVKLNKPACKKKLQMDLFTAVAAKLLATNALSETRMRLRLLSERQLQQ